MNSVIAPVTAPSLVILQKSDLDNALFFPPFLLASSAGVSGFLLRLAKRFKPACPIFLIGPPIRRPVANWKISDVIVLAKDSVFSGIASENVKKRSFSPAKSVGKLAVDSIADRIPWPAPSHMFLPKPCWRFWYTLKFSRPVRF